MRRGSVTVTLLAVALAACSDDDGPVSPVVVQATGAAMVAIEDGGGWRVLTPDEAGRIETAAREPYTLVRVCEDEDTLAHWHAVRSGAGAPPEWQLACRATVPLTIAAVGLRSGASAVVQVGRWQTSGATLYALPGSYDVVAVEYGVPPLRALVQRGVTIGGPATIDLDFARDGFALDERIFTPPATDWTVSAYSTWHTAGGTSVQIQESSGFLRFPPADRMSAGDVVTAGYYAQATDPPDSPDSYEAVVTVDPDAPLVLPGPPPPISAAALDGNPPRGVTWAYPGSWTAVTFEANSLTAGTARSWSLAAHDAGEGSGRIEVPEVTAIPGWRWGEDPVRGVLGVHAMTSLHDRTSVRKPVF
jgi:hypothetical protein